MEPSEFPPVAKYQDDVLMIETASERDPILEIFRREIDFTLVEKNLRLTLEERAQQLSNITKFLRKFRPLVNNDQR